MEEPSLLPSAIEAEKALLGSLLHAPHKTVELLDSRNFSPDWLSLPDHSGIYQGMRDMLREKRPLDLVSLTTFLEERKKDYGLISPTLAAVVTELFTIVPTGSNAAYYLLLVQEAYAKRIGIIDTIATEKKIREARSLQDVHDACQGAYGRVLEACVENDFDLEYDQEEQGRFLDAMELAATGKYTPEFFPTSFDTIDNECGGLMRGEVMLIRALKGCGKSLSMQAIIQRNIFDHRKVKASLYSFEMPYHQILRRLVASHGRVSLKSMRHSRYTGHELSNFGRAMTEIMGSNLRIYDTSRLGRATPKNIFASIRKRAKNEGLSIVGIDHLHLIRFDSHGKKNAPRPDENYHEFSAEFKQLCLEEKIVGILLAQENSEGGTFGGSQVETDVDWSITLNAVHKVINGKKRVVGVDSYFVDKSREGGLLGRKIPVKMEGEFATIVETKEIAEPDAAF